jgi:hypothetical protein
LGTLRHLRLLRQRRAPLPHLLGLLHLLKPLHLHLLWLLESTTQPAYTTHRSHALSALLL